MPTQSIGLGKIWLNCRCTWLTKFSGTIHSHSTLTEPQIYDELIFCANRIWNEGRLPRFWILQGCSKSRESARFPHAHSQAYRVVKRNFTQDIAVLCMLFDRAVTIFHMTSIKKHIEYFTFRNLSSWTTLYICDDRVSPSSCHISPHIKILQFILHCVLSNFCNAKTGFDISLVS